MPRRSWNGAGRKARRLGRAAFTVAGRKRKRDLSIAEELTVLFAGVAVLTAVLFASMAVLATVSMIVVAGRVLDHAYWSRR